MNTDALDDLARSLTGPFAFCGIGVSKGGHTHFALSTVPGISADENTLFRTASVSKIITAAAFEGAANGAGIDRPYDVDVTDILPLPVRHPAYSETPVTLGMLMTHTSGLSDAGGYAIQEPLTTVFDPVRVFGPHQPGTYFEYCNLGYILLAAAAEKLSGERFDGLVADSLSPNGLVGGFNWVSVPAERMRNTLPTFRRDEGRLIPQIDVPPLLADLPNSYVLGDHTALLSPQGGLRMSLKDMLGLAQILHGSRDQPLWHRNDGPGDYLDGLMQDYGAGLQFLPSPNFYPRALKGHFANAYGFKGGVWNDDAAGVSFAYALNGFPIGDEGDDPRP